MRARSLTTGVVAPIAAGGLVLALGGQAAGQPAPGALTLHIPHHAVAGQATTITGMADRSQAGRRVALEAAAPGSSSWHRLSSARIRRSGAFGFRVRPRSSMELRAVEQSPAIGNPLAMAATVPASSPTRSLTVSARLTLSERNLAVLGSGLVSVAGKLLPGHSGRTVRLQARRHGAWRTLSASQTGGRGGFRLRAHAQRGGEPLRVQFAGDSINGASTLQAGRVAEFWQAVVSWYDDAGQTACGFHAGYGVASRTLPCGTRLTFRQGARTVTATVDDRGPYVGGREFDLNQNTAAALGFAGVGTVWVAG